jgi:hypothetical protein
MYGLVVLAALLAGLLLGAWTATDLAASISDPHPQPLSQGERGTGGEEDICPDAIDSPPPDPTDLRCLTVAPTEIELCWRDNSCTEAGFHVERSTDGVNWVEVGIAPRNVASFRDTGLTPGTTYYYRVRAARLVTGEFSNYTNVAACTTSGLTLRTPANHSLVCNPSPIFSWQPVSGAITYTLQVGTTPDFTQSLAIHVTITGTTIYTPTTVLAAGDYFWRVRAENECASSEWSDAWQFRSGWLNQSPTPLSPPNGSTTCDDRPTFTWLAVPGALYYEIEVDGLVYPVFGTSFRSILNLGTGNRCWRVRAIGECGPGPWSERWCLAVQALPATPAVTAPPDNASLSTSRPTFEWTPSPGAHICCFQLDDDPAFGSPLIVACGVGSSFTPATDIPPGTYYWRIHCVNECGPGAWSSSRKLTIGAPASAPTPGTPPNNAIITDTTPTLTWSVVPGATFYRVQLTGGTCDFTTPLTDTLVLSPMLTIVTPLEPGTYCWRVQAINNFGPGPWSAPQTFTVRALSPPIPPDLSNPPDHSQTCDTTPTLGWSPVVTAFSYELQIDDGACDFAPPVVDVTVPVTSYTVSPALLPGTYCWRVRAINESGPGAWSGTWTFIIPTPSTAPPTPGLVSPPDGTQTCVRAPTLCWVAITDATSYDLELDGTVYTGLAGPCFNSPQLAAGSHTWRVRAVKDCSPGNWSDMRRFTIQTQGCPTGQGTVSGRVTLQGRSSGFGGIIVSADGVPCAVTGPDGQFNCNLAVGVHTLTAIRCKYLAAELSGITVTNGVTVTVREALLTGGDTNNDTHINLFDLVAAGGAYGNCPGPDVCPGSDINGDGCTNIFDLVILGGNYGLNGPTAWTRPATLVARAAAPARLELVADGRRWLVRLNDAADVYGVQLRLRYDPARLHVRDADGNPANGVQVRLPGLDTLASFVVENAVDPASGEVRIAFTLLNPAPALNGDVVLVEIPVEATGDPAGGGLAVVDVLLGDRNGRRLPVTWAPAARRDYWLYLPFVVR